MRYPFSFGLFKDKQKKQEFIKQGYCVIQIRDLSILDKIDKVYHELNLDTQNQALYASNSYGEYTSNILIHEIIQELFKTELHLYFENFLILVGHFLEKKPHSEIGFQLHQDWNVTDESKYLSAHVWIPHQDTNKENGGLYVIPGSHRYFNNYRSGSLDIPRIESNRYLNLITKDLNIKKGEMLVFHPALFHGSYVNSTKHPRIATLINIIQDESPITYYHLHQQKIDVYHITQRALMADLNLMIQHQIPKDSIYSHTIEYYSLKNADINTKSLVWQYIKSKLMF